MDSAGTRAIVLPGCVFYRLLLMADWIRGGAHVNEVSHMSSLVSTKTGDRSRSSWIHRLGI